MASIEVDIKRLFESGAHFGHKSSRWHPAMAEFIHSKRGDIYVIDLVKTGEKLDDALAAVTKTVAGGGQVLFVSTKKQTREAVQEAAEAVGMPYVVNRWLGGMLTNRKTMSERIKHLKDLENKMASGELAAKYSKLEVQRFQEEIDHMNELYGGIKEMHSKPGILFITDIISDSNAVKEADKLGIPVIGISDTNSDPRTVKYPVPANDDSLKTMTIILEYVNQAIADGKAQQKDKKSDDVKDVKLEEITKK